MSPTFAVLFWATTAFAACSMRTRAHYAEDDAARAQQYHPGAARFQSRASSMFGPSGHAAGFPYRFVFPANHPALNGPAGPYPQYPQYSQYPQNPRQSEQLQYAADDVYTLTSSKHVPFAEHKQPQPHHQQQQHQQQQQQQQQQQLGFESVGKLQYEFFGDGGGKHHVQQPYHMTKQPKHYQNYELAPSAPATVHQSPYVSAGGGGPIAQPIMLLLPSGQPGAPYQTLVLVPSSSVSSIPPGFPGVLPPAFPGQFGPNLPIVRGLPLQIAGFPSAGGAGPGKFAGTQLFHRSHDPVQPYPHRQQTSKTLQKSSSYPHGSGSEHVPQSTGGGAEVQQPLEDKVGHGSGASAENPDERVDGGSVETKGEEKTSSSTEFGDKTSTKTPTRIVVT